LKEGRMKDGRLKERNDEWIERKGGCKIEGLKDGRYLLLCNPT
jgi:hypothetical protein